MLHFEYYTKQQVQSLTHVRKFETRLGERLMVPKENASLDQILQDTTADFVVLGIPETIGVRANNEFAATDTAWQPFVEEFVNMQSNDFLEGSNILLLGYFDFAAIGDLIEKNAHNTDEKVYAYRHAVTQMDEAIEPVIKLITQYGKLPIIIGGGHNNAYPLIKGAAKGLYKASHIPIASINCINLDAHIDFRPMEGRHSGNAFTYAEEDGFLQKFCAVGVHENAIAQNIWMDVVNNPFIDVITYEDIFIHEKRNFLEAIALATTFTEDSYTGIEVDLDCVETVLGSAAPAGILPVHARQFVSYTAGDSKTAYLHICGGVATLPNGGSNEFTGKLIACLVSDFIKAKE